MSGEKRGNRFIVIIGEDWPMEEECKCKKKKKKWTVKKLLVSLIGTIIGGLVVKFLWDFYGPELIEFAKLWLPSLSAMASNLKIWRA
jgi:hypothetical protein